MKRISFREINIQKAIIENNKRYSSIVDSNLNVSGYVEEPDEDENIPKEDIPESEYTATEDVYYLNQI